jgi:hypothetical protein
MRYVLFILFLLPAIASAQPTAVDVLKESHTITNGPWWKDSVSVDCLLDGTQEVAGREVYAVITVQDTVVDFQTIWLDEYGDGGFTYSFDTKPWPTKPQLELVAYSAKVEIIDADVELLGIALQYLSKASGGGGN